MAVNMRPEILKSTECEWKTVTPATVTALLRPVSGGGGAGAGGTGESGRSRDGVD